MKDEATIRHAREVVKRAFLIPGLHQTQHILLSGLSVALQWVCDEGGTTLQRLVDGEPMGTNKTEQEVEHVMAQALARLADLKASL